jgi:hypothetical protein
MIGFFISVPEISLIALSEKVLVLLGDRDISRAGN